MLIKKLNFNHYKLIKKFLKFNNSSLPSKKSLKSFNDITKKNSSFFMEGLFQNNKLVGYHSVIIKLLIFRKKTYKILVSSNWNVSKKYRKGSFFLINNYFNQNCDFFLTTTANEKASIVWKTLGGVGVNPITSKLALFQIVNYSKLIESYLRRKKIKFIPKLIIYVFSFFVEFFNKKKNYDYLNCNLEFNEITENSYKLENFNKKFEINCKYPVEKRSNFILSRNINSLKLNKKKTYIYEILDKKKMIGYFVLAKERYAGIKRIFICDVRIDYKYYKFINFILDFINLIAKKENCTYLYYKNINPTIFKKINLKNFLITKYNFNPYMIKIGSKKGKKLKKYLINNWGTSYLDGDCLL